MVADGVSALAGVGIVVLELDDELLAAELLVPVVVPALLEALPRSPARPVTINAKRPSGVTATDRAGNPRLIVSMTLRVPGSIRVMLLPVAFAVNMAGTATAPIARDGLLFRTGEVAGAVVMVATGVVPAVVPVVTVAPTAGVVETTVPLVPTAGVVATVVPFAGVVILPAGVAAEGFEPPAQAVVRTTARPSAADSPLQVCWGECIRFGSSSRVV